jgi:hypothetical protein
MDRRGFIKNSIGALLFGALTSNKVLAEVVDTMTPKSPKVLLFLIQNKKGQWKVRGTKWIDIAKKRLDLDKVNIETFKPLEIVDNDKANDRKNELWKIYNCRGEKGAPLDVVESANRVKDNHTKSEKMKAYVVSDLHKKNRDKAGSLGGKVQGKVLGQKNKETGWMNKIRPEGQLEYFNTFSKEERMINSIKGGKAASVINLKSGQVAMAQELAAKTRRKKVKCTKTGNIYESLKQCAKDNDLYYPSLKNMLNNNSGRKNNTTFVYV